MPHIILEYSEQLERRVGIFSILKKVHNCLAEQESFDKESIKSRGIAYKFYNVTTFDDEKSFVHLQLRVFQGRTKNIIKTAIKNISKLVLENIPEDTELTIEVCEINKDFYFKRAAR